MVLTRACLLPDLGQDLEIDPLAGIGPIGALTVFGQVTRGAGAVHQDGAMDPGLVETIGLLIGALTVLGQVTRGAGTVHQDGAMDPGLIETIRREPLSF